LIQTLLVSTATKRSMEASLGKTFRCMATYSGTRAND
jgi:hypothetical protein